MSGEAPKEISGKWLLVGFLSLVAVAAAIIVAISLDVDRRTEKAKELESQMGRKVGPEDSPKHQNRLLKWRERQKTE